MPLRVITELPVPVALSPTDSSMAVYRMPEVSQPVGSTPSAFLAVTALSLVLAGTETTGRPTEDVLSGQIYTPWSRDK